MANDKRRILFVDDEPRILSGLKRMLFGLRNEWVMDFANSGKEALEMFEREPFEVVISDMRMPGMDGATLLTELKARYPSTIRIILSGHTEEEAAIRALPVAHQFLAKPCDADTLKRTVTKAFALQQSIGTDRVQEVVGGVDQIPSAPTVYLRLTEALADPSVDINDIAALVEQDAALAGNVLHMVNTAFFGQPRCTTGVGTAVSLLGTKILRNLVLSAEVFSTFCIDQQDLPDFSADGQMRHMGIVARVASRIEPGARWKDEAFTAGLLHDLGKLVLAMRVPDAFREALTLAHEQGRPVHECEQELLGTTHAAVGAYILGLWGLPADIVEAVAVHHNRELLSPDTWDAGVAVHVADFLAHAQDRADATGDPVDLSGLDWLGRQSDYPEWTTLVADVVAEVQSAAGAMS